GSGGGARVCVVAAPRRWMRIVSVAAPRIRGPGAPNAAAWSSGTGCQREARAMTSSGGPVTVLLREMAAGSERAADELMVLVYSELRALAAHYLKGERDARTLQPTALVHEAWVRLAEGAAVDATDRTHFFALAARVMRNVLVDAARKRDAAKR